MIKDLFSYYYITLHKSLITDSIIFIEITIIPYTLKIDIVFILIENERKFSLNVTG